METLAAGEIFLFEDFRVDRRGLFRRDERGVFVPVAIGSRAFDVLRVLITARGELVSKDEIMAAVWPGTVVEDNNLTRPDRSASPHPRSGPGGRQLYPDGRRARLSFCCGSDAARGG